MYSRSVILVMVVSGATSLHADAPIVVDLLGDVGRWSSLAVVNGAPAIAYLDATNAALKYVRAADPEGSSWNAPVVPDGGGGVWGGISLEVVNGAPAISYLDSSLTALKYVRALDAAGGSWGPPQVVTDIGAPAQGSTSLGVVNGAPAISYFANSPLIHLRFIRANDASGASWGSAVSVDTSSMAGYDNSLAVVDGRPAIAYAGFGGSYIRYARALDANGTSWAPPLTLTTVTAWYQLVSLAVVNGNPAVVYGGDSGLTYLRAVDPEGNVWGAALTLDHGAYPSVDRSLAVVNGNPAVAYYTIEGPTLITAGDPDGATWNAPITFDSDGTSTSLAEVAGAPAISYQYQPTRDLRYVRDPAPIPVELQGFTVD